MSKAVAVLVGVAMAAAACGGSPTRPSRVSSTARLSRTRFMAFGDSLTAGEVTAPIALLSGGITKQIVVPSAAYPAQLQSMLASRYASQAASIRVVNAGLGGETLVSGLLRFEDELTANAPEAVIIMEGVNGLASIGPEISTLLVREMTRSAKNARARVFVGSMLPTITGRLRSQNPALLEAYNAGLRQMSGEEGVVFVDLYTALLPEALESIGIDGLHPTEAGYRKIAELFFAAIKGQLEER